MGQNYAWLYVAANAAMGTVDNMQKQPGVAQSTMEHWVEVLQQELPDEVAEGRDVAGIATELRKDLEAAAQSIDEGHRAMHRAALAFATAWRDEVDSLYAMSTQESEQGRQASASE